MGAEVGEAEGRRPALPQAQDLARPAEAEILLRDREAVVGGAQDLQPGPGGNSDRGARSGGTTMPPEITSFMPSSTVMLSGTASARGTNIRKP